MNPQTLKDIKTLSSIQPEHIRKYDRMDIVIKFMQAKKEHPDYKKNQLCALIGVSDSYLKRVMKDLDIKSFYRHDIPINKKNNMKVNKNIDEKIEDTSDNNQPVIKKEIKTKRKSQQLKGGGINPENITDEYIEKLIN
jgi:hypothetical protein